MLTAADFRVDTEAASPEALTWQLPVRHFSASSISTVLCPEQWRQQYLLKKPRSSSAALVIGTAVHDTLAVNFRQKLQSGVDIDAGTVVEVYETIWPLAVKDKGEVDWGKYTKADRKAKGQQIVSAYIAEVAPRLEPIAVEQQFLARIIPGLPVPVKGYVDLVVPGRVIDYKTSSRAVRTAKSEWMPQGRIYQMVYPYDFEWHVATTAAQVQLLTPLDAPDLSMRYSLEGIRNAQVMVRDAAWLLNYLYVVLGPERPWPTLGVYTDRSCVFCSFRRDCPAWRS